MKHLEINGEKVIIQSINNCGGNISANLALFNSKGHVATKHLSINGDTIITDSADYVKGTGRPDEVFEVFLATNKRALIDFLSNQPSPITL